VNDNPAKAYSDSTLLNHYYESRGDSYMHWRQGHGHRASAAGAQKKNRKTDHDGHGVGLQSGVMRPWRQTGLDGEQQKRWLAAGTSGERMGGYQLRCAGGSAFHSSTKWTIWTETYLEQQNQ
jgi:hypothetical protein